MKRLFGTAMALLLAGCATVGPNYHGPGDRVTSQPLANGAFASGTGDAFVDGLLPGQWWRLYADSRLDALIREALATNSDLAVAAANIELAEAKLREVDSSRRPRTSIDGGVKLGRLPRVGTDEPVTLGYTGGISISYEVDLVGRLRRLSEAAKADVGAAQAARDLARTMVVAHVVDAYAQACASAHQRATALHSVDIQQRSLGMTDRLIAAGRANALDHSRAMVQVEQLRATVPDFDAAHDNALFRLAVLLGRPPAGSVVEAATCDTPLQVSTPLPIGDGGALIRRRPDIRTAERAIAAASAHIGVATAELYPRVELGGAIGLAGPLSQLVSTNGIALSLGPLISWSFPDRSVARARIDQATAVDRAAIAHFDGVVLNALGEAETALTSYGRERDRNGALRSARDAAATAAAQARELQRFGRANEFLVLDAERTLAAADAALAASDTLVSRDQVAVFLALGGGWEAGPA